MTDSIIFRKAPKREEVFLNEDDIAVLRTFFASPLTDARERLNMSIPELSKRYQELRNTETPPLSRVYLTRLERGDIFPPLSRLDMVAECYGFDSVFEYLGTCCYGHYCSYGDNEKIRMYEDLFDMQQTELISHFFATPMRSIRKCRDLSIYDAVELANQKHQSVNRLLKGQATKDYSLSYSSLYNYEHALRYPPLPLLTALLEAYRIKPAYFFLAITYRFLFYAQRKGNYAEEHYRT